MTILNIALGAHELAIVTDSRQSAMTSAGRIALPQHAQKCEAFPMLNILLAHSGDAGAGTIARDLGNYLRWGIVAGNVPELATRLPGVLTDLSRTHNFSGFGRIALAGVVADRAYCFLLDAPSWTAQPVPQGVWVQPSPLPAELPQSAAQDERQPVADLTPRRAVPVFRDSLVTIRQSVEWQHDQNSVSCGGAIVESYIDNSLIIRQHVLRVFE